MTIIVWWLRGGRGRVRKWDRRECIFFGEGVWVWGGSGGWMGYVTRTGWEFGDGSDNSGGRVKEKEEGGRRELWKSGKIKS